MCSMFATVCVGVVSCNNSVVRQPCWIYVAEEHHYSTHHQAVSVSVFTQCMWCTSTLYSALHFHCRFRLLCKVQVAFSALTLNCASGRQLAYRTFCSNDLKGLAWSTWKARVGMKNSALRRRKHCVLAVVRWSRKISPATHPRPGCVGRPKFNQLEMVTTFTYKPSLVRIDAHNFELSW